MKSLRTLLRPAAFLALALASLSARASQFGLTYTVGGVSAALTLIADPIAGSPGQYHVTGVSGTRGGQAVTGFYAGGPSQFGATPTGGGNYSLDNVLYVPAVPAYLDYYSFAYKVGSLSYNPYFQNGAYSELDFDGAGNNVTVGVTNLAVTPEPSALAALGLGMAAMLRRRRKA